MKTAGMAARGDENMAAAGKEEDRHRASLWKEAHARIRRQGTPWMGLR